MAAQRHEVSLRVLKNISQVSAPFELFYDELKVTKCCTDVLSLLVYNVVKLLSCVA